MDKEHSFWRLPLQIVATVFLLALIGAVADVVFFRLAADQVVVAANQINEDAQRSLQRIQQEQQQRIERQRLQQQQELRAKAAEAQAAADHAREAAVVEARKQAAWSHYYRQPAKCENPSDFDVNVECGNAYIRAKREFEIKWASSQAQLGG